MGGTGRMLVVRHGDRFDYANPDWRLKTLANGRNVRDPPLSRLGWKQAEETGQRIVELTKEWPSVDAILVSPYLRVIQTALPLATKLGVPLMIEEGLSETHHSPGMMPSAKERFAYFPVVDTEYQSMFNVVADGCVEGSQYESYPIGYMRRMFRVAETFTEKLAEKNVICFTHAASVALVSALIEREMPQDESLKFAPCGIFQLEHSAKSGWTMIESGSDNTKHVSTNCPTTSPWGFSGVKLVVWNALFREERLRAKL